MYLRFVRWMFAWRLFRWRKTHERFSERWWDHFVCKRLRDDDDERFDVLVCCLCVFFRNRIDSPSLVVCRHNTRTCHSQSEDDDDVDRMKMLHVEASVDVWVCMYAREREGEQRVLSLFASVNTPMKNFLPNVTKLLCLCNQIAK